MGYGAKDYPLSSNWWHLLFRRPYGTTNYAASGEPDEARTFLSYLRNKGITIKVTSNGQKLEWTGNTKREDEQTIKRLKQELMQILMQR
jgi:hypothetical protein